MTLVVRIEWQIFDLKDEGEGGFAKRLMGRPQSGALVDAAEPQTDLAVGVFAPHRRSTVAAEELVARPAAVAHLPVRLGLAGLKLKTTGKSGDCDPVS